MFNRQIHTISAILITTLFIAFGASGQEAPATEVSNATDEPRSRNWTLRFGLLVAESAGDTSVTVEPGTVNVSIDTGGGGFVSFERRMSPLLGLEMGLLGMGSEIDVWAHTNKHCCSTNVDVMAMGSLTLGLNFHFLKDGPIDFYAGPLLAFNNYAEVSVRSGIGDEWPEKQDEWTTVRTRNDSEVTWGAKAGVDFLLGTKQHWSVGGSLTYMDATYDFERLSEPGSTEISLDPLMFSVGVGFRF